MPTPTGEVLTGFGVHVWLGAGTLEARVLEARVWVPSDEFQRRAHGRRSRSWTGRAEKAHTHTLFAVLLAALRTLFRNSTVSKGTCDRVCQSAYWRMSACSVPVDIRTSTSPQAVTFHDVTGKISVISFGFVMARRQIGGFQQVGLRSSGGVANEVNDGCSGVGSVGRISQSD